MPSKRLDKAAARLDMRLREFGCVVAREGIRQMAAHFVAAPDRGAVIEAASKWAKDAGAKVDHMLEAAAAARGARGWNTLSATMAKPATDSN
jgi:hypothetical protein